MYQRQYSKCMETLGYVYLGTGDIHKSYNCIEESINNGIKSDNQPGATQESNENDEANMLM